jgi:hypothetical protein
LRPSTEPPSTSRARSTARVDLVDLAQEGERLVGAELAGAGHEGADVLGQAAAAEPEAGVEESAADAGVVTDGIRQLGHVGSRRLAHLGHRVDERDLRREERVRRRLHQLGGLEVGRHDGGAIGDRGGVDLVERRAHRLGRGRVVGQAVDQPVGMQGVFDREAFTQELGVPRDDRAGSLEPSRERSRSADGHRRLAHHKVTRGEHRGEGIHGGMHVAQVGGERPRLLRGADGDEVHGVATGLAHVGREAQPPGGEGPVEQLWQAGLEERRQAARECRDLRLVDVDADDVVAEFGHAGRVYCSEVAAADHRHAHGGLLSQAEFVGAELRVGERRVNTRRLSRQPPARCGRGSRGRP